MTGLYPLGTSCSNPTGAVYTSSNDAWGNVTSRTYNGSTATLSYDLLDQLVQWNAGASSQEWYAYDLGGNRTLRRSTTGSGTTLTVYAFGLQEHVYSASGTPQSSTYYYSVGGRLIGELQGSTTQFFLSDALGSILTTFTAVAGAAAVQGNQVYGPYGSNRYSKGSMGTTKGFTGQYADATGLDYDNARYYDPVIGRFLSADTVQGNGAGMDPYDYVGGNPETLSDPTGHKYVPAGGPEGDPGPPSCDATCQALKNVPGGSGCGASCSSGGTQACDPQIGCHTKGVGQGTVYVKVTETHEVDVTSYASVCYVVFCVSVPTVHKSFITTSHYVGVHITFGVDVCLSGVVHGCGEGGGDDSDNTDDNHHTKPNILASDAAGDATGGGSQQTDPEADAFAKKVFKDLANSGADVRHRVVAVNLSDDGNTLIAINEISANGEDVTDATAEQLKKMTERLYGARYVGPLEARNVGRNFEDLDHAEVWIANVLDAERLPLRIGTALRAPCVVCYDILEYVGSISP